MRSSFLVMCGVLLGGPIFGTDEPSDRAAKPKPEEEEWLNDVWQKMGQTGSPITAKQAAREAANAMRAFKYDPGMKVELWASEPLLGNPVAFYPDERGRWYVSESYRQEGRSENGRPIVGGVVDNRGHMRWLDDDIASRSTDDRLAMMRKYFPDPKKFSEAFEKQEERIVLLEDTAKAGRADKSTIFADGFREALDGTAAGVLVRGPDVWWTNIPNLWHFTDADGDGRADTREKLLSGFGVKFAFRGHDMHGLRFGPDGKLYFSIGDRALNVKNKEGQQWEVSETGSILRCNPDGTEFEVFATGVRNPQELAFDEWGNLFTGDNNSDSGDRARFVQLVEGGDCGWRMGFQYLDDRGPWNREMLWDEKQAPRARYIIPPIANLASGPSGLTYNPGTGLSPRYTGSFFLSDFRGGAGASVVHQISLEQSGAWYRLKERRDFVKGILTSDVEFGMDGSLYVLDWVESWSGANKGRIYKFTAPDANTARQAEVQKLLADGMNHRRDKELTALLAHEDQRVRQAAQFRLAEKDAVRVLTETAQKGGGTLPRIHAVWGLGQVSKKHPEALLSVAGLLSDGNQEVRAQAARVLGDRRYLGANEALVNALRDGYPRVRFYAALALGKTGHKAAVEPLFAMLADNADRDPIVRHGAVMGLTGCADAEQLAARVTDASPAIRGGAVVALRRQKSPQVAAFLNDNDQSIVLEAARAIYDVPIAEAMPDLARLVTDKRVRDRNIILRSVSANYRLGQLAEARTLAACAADPQANETTRRESLLALAAWGNPSPKDRLLNLWRPLPARGSEDAVTALAPLAAGLLRNAPPSVQEVAASTAGVLKLPDLDELLFTLAASDKTSKNTRIQALDALIRFNSPKLSSAATEAITDRDPRLRAAGLRALVAVNPDGALAAISAVLSSNASASEKQGAVRALSESRSADADRLIGGLMDQLIAGKIAPEVQLDVFEAARKRGGLTGKLQQWKATLPQGDVLAPYQLSLFGGDAEKGKKLFREHPAAQCFKCHRCEGGDSLVGPDLTRIGAEKDRQYLLESIVLPDKRVAQDFQIVVLELTDDSTVAGRVLNEKHGIVQVETVDATGKPQTVNVPANKIKKRTSAPSPMPAYGRDVLSRSDLRDIVEYLATRK